MRLSAQRVIFLLLLVSRLVLGDFASAMPDHGAAHSDHAASAQMADDSCPDHASKESGKTHGDDCCKSAGGCPCLHFSVLAAPSLITLALLDEARPQWPVIGATPGHVRRILRPPA